MVIGSKQEARWYFHSYKLNKAIKPPCDTHTKTTMKRSIFDLSVCWLNTSERIIILFPVITALKKYITSTENAALNCVYFLKICNDCTLIINTILLYLYYSEKNNNNKNIIFSALTRIFRHSEYCNSFILNS